ncbi:MAG TPA: DUF1501 domain-containing protein [Gemmataceae bacterium]|jgi:hypothetical protein|nr:DUF1501 domain-containing protein [Gemmataceae bacterium]
MLTIKGPAQRLCEGISRRDFLRVGAIGGVGLSLPALLKASAAGPKSAAAHFGKARRCILLFLTGGPPQLDTWDLKPNAPEQIRGELKPIATNAVGVQISELLPRLARQADKYCIVRSVTHGDTTHTSAGYTMLTGAYHPQPNTPTAQDIRPTPDDHPHFGSVLAKFRASRGGAPVFASLPQVIKDAGVNVYPGQDAGFLGNRSGPFTIQGDPRTGAFHMPEIALPADVTAERLADRRLLAARLDRSFRTAHRQAAVADLGGFHEQAFALLCAPAVRQAFDLSREPERLRQAYGRHLFGQGCLLARRLVEAGVALVTVYWHYEGPDDSPVWDTHENNFVHLRKRLAPPTDQAFAALLEDLSARGLLAETLVVCMGEFGRSPRINPKGGRDHWSNVQSVVLAGAGIRGGSVYGASDRIGAYPGDSPVTPPELTATFLHLLGVRPDLEVHDHTGRPLRVCEGAPVRGLLA